MWKFKGKKVLKLGKKFDMGCGSGGCGNTSR